KVVGVDADSKVVERHRHNGRRVLRGDAGDPDFWDNVDKNHSIALVMLALPGLSANLNALKQLREGGYDGKVAAIAHYKEDEALLKKAGADAVFNIYSGAGFGFADHVSPECFVDSA
ncbi:MAG TPA: potassium transporter Kef, partial [Gammaproteobacteria bacterium]|nr:potassium transporter Kef [Gammaproteobacteria bacterium]